MDTIMSKKGFILIEIIVSVMLLSFAGIALMKINSNQKNIYTIASKKLEFSKYISLLVNRHSIDLHNKELELYDLVKREYNLKDDELIKILKNSKVKYSQEYRSVINLNLDYSEEKINILIDEIKISDKKASSIYITVKL
jgi:hypothetical protein